MNTGEKLPGGGLPKNIYAIPIESLDSLTKQIVGLLHEGKIFTVGDLLEYSRSDLSELVGIGEARIARICSCLEKELGLPLPDDWYTPLGDRLLGDDGE